MRHPEDDVFLRDGQGYMVGQEPYRTHIRITPERKQVSYSFQPEALMPEFVLCLEIPLQQPHGC